jgi:hypothetical protein
MTEFEQALHMPTTLSEKIACIEREIRMRQRVYPRWVADRKMKQETAEHEIACRVEIAELLRSLR